MPNLLPFVKKNWFLIGLLLVILIGLNFPGIALGLDEKGMASYSITVLLFLITGFTLPTETIRHGMANIRLHLYIQSFIFIVMPLYFYGTSQLFKHVSGGALVYGLLALAVLPTTISTCVVFTQSSGGDTVAALFNSAFANMIGIVLSPFLLSFFLQGTSTSLSGAEMKAVFTGLFWKMVIPILIGQGLRAIMGQISHSLKRKLSICSSSLILCMVLLTFSGVASDETFLASLTSAMFLPFAFLAVSHLLMVLLAYLGAVLFHFPIEEKITILFVAPQKTMALGVPLLSVYFANNPSLLGFALLPLLFYHPWQLMVAGVLRSLIQAKRSQT